MFSTHFFNVGHGEAMIIELDQFERNRPHWIIRDFGQSRSAIKTNYSVIPSQILGLHHCSYYWHRFLRNIPHNGMIDIVLSHAHEDHFNGYAELFYKGKRKIFNNAYIPALDMSTLEALGGVLIKYSLLVYRYLGPAHPYAKEAKHWLLAAPILAGLSKKVLCVYEGYQIKDWGIKNRVLWPCLTNNITKLLKDRLDLFFEENPRRSDILDNDAEAIRLELSKFYLMEDIENTDKHSHPIEQIDNTIHLIEERLGNRYEASEATAKKVTKLYTHSYKRAIDNNGLMFEIGEGGDMLLFLSDAFDGTVAQMLKSNNIVGRHYRLIKAAHHGTRGAKALKTAGITSNHVVICCGPVRNGYKGPNVDYTQVSPNVICTDWNHGNAKWMDIEKFSIAHANCISYEYYRSLWRYMFK